MVPARAAKNCPPVKFVGRPSLSGVAGYGGVAVEARIPAAAAFESDGDDVELTVIMRAARLRVDFDPVNLFALDFPHGHPSANYRT